MGIYIVPNSRNFLSLSGGTVSGGTYFSNSLSANTFYSGSTPLEQVIYSISSQYSADTSVDVFIQPGINTYTGGTLSNPTVNLSSLTVDYIVVTGNSLFNSIQVSSFTGSGIMMVVTDNNGNLSIQSVPSAGQSTIIRNGLNTYTAGTVSDYSVNVSALTINTLSASGNSIFSGTLSGGSQFSAGTIYSGSTNIGTIFSQVGHTHEFSTILNTAHTHTIADVVNLSGSLSTKVNKSGDTMTGGLITTSLSATTLSGGTIYSGSTNIGTIFSQIGHTHEFSTILNTAHTHTISDVNNLQGSLNTKVNKSGDTMTGGLTTPSLSATTLSGATIYSGNTNLYNIFSQLGHTHQFSTILNTAHTHTIADVENLSSSLNTKVNKSGDTMTGGLISPSLSATTLSGGTIYSGNTNLYNIFSTHDYYVTGFAYDNANKLVITDNSGSTFNAVLNQFTGITVNGLINNPSGIIFNLTAITNHTEGQIHWDDNDKTLELDTDVNNVHIQLGQENVVRVVNKTGSDILNGSVVYVSGAQGNRPTISLADYSTEEKSHGVIGITTHDIGNNNNGYVTTFGLVRTVNTASYTAGTTLYLYTGGTYTDIIPISPNHHVKLGYVIVSDATDGVILVSPQDGMHLNQLSDVYVTGITNGQLISYNSSNLRWENTSNISISSISANTIYSGNTNLQSIFVTSGVTLGSGVPVFLDKTGSDLRFRSLSAGTNVSLSTDGNVVVINSTGGSSGGTETYIQPGTNTYTGGTSINPTINVSALTIDNLSVSGVTILSSTTASTLNINSLTGGGTLMLVTDNNGNISAQSIPAAGQSTIIRNGLNTYTAGTISDYTVNVSALTINTLSASGNSVFLGTLSGGSQFSAGTINSGSTNLYNIFSQIGHTHEFSSILNTAHTHTISDVNNLQGILDGKVNKSGDTMTGGLITTSLSATTLSGGTIYSGSTNLEDIFYNIQYNSGSLSLQWKFSTSTVSSDPGAGYFRYNNGILSSITEIYVDKFSETPGVDCETIFSALTGNYTIFIQQKDDSSKYILTTLSGSVVNNTGWFTIPVSVNSYGPGGTPLNNKLCVFVFINKNGTSNLVSSIITQGNIQDTGTPTVPILSTVSSPSFNNITISGNGVFNALTSTTVSGGTIYSGNTNLYNIFSQIGHTHEFSAILNTAHTHSISDITNLQGSLNTKVNKSGDTMTGELIVPSLSGTVISGGTFYSGNTPLSNYFGEVNSAFNIGSGVTIFSAKVGTDLYFSTISGGTDIYVESGDTILIHSVPGASNAIIVGAATTGNIANASYYNGVNGVGAIISGSTNGTFPNLDGIVIYSGQTILIKDQTNKILNGIYYVNDRGTASSRYLLTRETVSDETSEFSNQIVFVSSGSTQKGRYYTQTTADPQIGVNDINYDLLGGINTYVLQTTTGTQRSGQIPTWTSSTRTLAKGDENFVRNDTTKFVGINVGLNPVSTFDVSGSTGLGSVHTIYSSITITDWHKTILASANTSDIVIVLSAASLTNRREFNISKIDSTTNKIIISGISSTIDGKNFVTLLNQWDTTTIKSNGSNYYSIVLPSGSYFTISGGTITGSTYVSNNFSASTIYSGFTNIGNMFVYSGRNMENTFSPVFNGRLGNDLLFKTIRGGNNISLSADSNTITITNSLAIPNGAYLWTSGTGTNSIRANNGTLINGGDYGLVAGQNNFTNTNHSTILGGVNNSANSISAVYSVKKAFLGNGYKNTIEVNTSSDKPYSSILNGKYNKVVNSKYSFVAGGLSNIISGGSFSSILNGSNNTLRGSYSLMAGGGNIDADTTFYSFTFGKTNVNTQGYSFVHGYSNSNTTGNYSFIHGATNINTGGFSAIFGENNNVLNSFLGFVLGGNHLLSSATFSGIFGGNFNSGFSSSNSAVIGGTYNIISGATNSVILGGNNYTLTTNDTVLVPKLKIANLPLSSGTYSLVADSNGNVSKVIYGNSSGNYLSISGGTITGNTILSSTTASTITVLGLSGGGTLMVVTDNNGNLSTQSIPVAGQSTIIRSGLNTYTAGTFADYTVNISALTINTLTASGNSVFSGTLSGGSQFSAGTIYSGSTNLYNIFSQLGHTHEFSTILNTAHTHTIADVLNLSGSLNTKVNKSGDTMTGGLITTSLSATTLSGGTIYSGSTNIGTIFSQVGHTHEFSTILNTAHTHTISDVENLSGSLNTKVNKSGDTMTGGLITTSLSATTLSGGTIYSGNTNLYNVFSQVGHTHEFSTILNTAHTHTIVDVENLSGSLNTKVNKSGDTMTGGLITTSLSATTLSGATINSGTTNLYNIFSQLGHTHEFSTILNTAHTHTISDVNSLQGNLDTKVNKSGDTMTGGLTTTSLSATTLSGGTIYSGNTNLYNIFSQLGHTHEFSTILNTAHTHTISDVENLSGSLNTKVNKSGDTMTGGLITTSLSATTLSGGTIYSGNTNLYNIFSQLGHTHEFSTILNTAHTHSISDINNLQGSLDTKVSKSGDTMTGGLITTSLSATTLSGGTIYSGNTNLTDLFAISGVSLGGAAIFTGKTNGILQFKGLSAGTNISLTSANDVIMITASGGPGGDPTYVQPGTNTYTGGTSTAPTVNVSALTINNLSVSGSSVLNSVSANTLTANTVSASTIYSGSTNIEYIFASSAHTHTGGIGFVIDNGSSVITTGLKGYVTIPYNATIVSWTVMADTSGSIVIDVWKDTYANYPPTVSDTITGTEKITLSSQQKNQDLNLTSWTTSISSGDVLAFNVDSVSTVKKVYVMINVIKTI